MVYGFPQQFFAEYWRTRPDVFCKKLLLQLSQNYQENTSVEVSFLIKLFLFLIKFIKKETPALVLSFEFYKIFKGMQLY